ncbi:MAG: glycosyltransferase family 2 protein [Flavobacteriaceae bacterium CG_4_10_14_3_um_filter_33_47]|nr:MAG: glycosyltransferase family 2 protein [Flavobacteriaceae bacterium CG17_big_fil_post_rev_8_21_14_2_50_33_15]PIY11384.1 MAG: glycosyltransferase family 2 protein [Flavobacteriaceae bacterium CG_4_10_14_3_um_filter_33_47]PJB19201.1 MAG: glycosyltransferase family 2 protein [Flavobacteriaceae bacterium CG_4_9_14_3_um_filter_33_16]
MLYKPKKIMPFFSVIIPLFNKEKFIKQTLLSVLNQTLTDFEVIIINDGSTDDSLSIASSLKDKRIQILNQQNKGLCASRNLGIKTSKGTFMAFLDADDLWMEDFLETIYKLIQLHQEQLIFATNVKLLFPNKTPNLNSTTFSIDKKTLMTNYFRQRKNILGPSSLVINKLVFEEVGYFDETINYGEEDDFYIRCFNIYNLIYYNDFKTYYRTGLSNQLTAPNKNFERKIPDYEKYLKNTNNPDLKKFLDFVHYRLVVLFKMEKNHKLVKFYKKKIDISNLTGVQKLKYFLPADLFYITKIIYTILLKNH